MIGALPIFAYLRPFGRCLVLLVLLTGGAFALASCKEKLPPCPLVKVRTPLNQITKFAPGAPIAKENVVYASRIRGVAVKCTYDEIKARQSTQNRDPSDGMEVLLKINFETVRGAANHPGSMSYADLAAYRAIERAPVCIPYRQWRVCGMGPPSSGGLAVAQTLGMLAGFELGRLKPASPDAVHLMIEAEALAFADRNAYVADPDFVPVPVAGMLDAVYLKARAALIDSSRAGPKREPGRPAGAEARLSPEVGGDKGLSTTHFAIVDDAGNAVSMTSSIETVFGSRLMTGGFILNNQLTDFSFRPAIDGRPVANSVAPAKRPRSSMSPTIVLDAKGRLVMAIGSPGGSRIIGFVLKALVAALDWRMPMPAAVDLPNFLSRNGGAELEQGAADGALAPALEALGHKVKLFPLESGLHGIRVTPKGLEGGADKRREGVVLAK